MALQQLLGVSELKGKASQMVPVSSLEGKPCFIYFSAHWCPPCRAFTPVLANLYQEQKAKGKEFEIVFASWDQTQTEFEGYYKEHPWLAIPYAQRDVVDKLQQKFRVQSIPTLILVDEKGVAVTTNARNIVVQDSGPNTLFPWTSEEARKKIKTGELGSVYGGSGLNLPKLVLFAVAAYGVIYLFSKM